MRIGLQQQCDWPLDAAAVTLQIFWVSKVFNIQRQTWRARMSQRQSVSRCSPMWRSIDCDVAAALRGKPNPKCVIGQLSWQIGKRSCDFKTLESTSCDSLSHNCKIGRFCRLPLASPRSVGASTDQLPLVPRFPLSLAGLILFEPF